MFTGKKTVLVKDYGLQLSWAEGNPKNFAYQRYEGGIYVSDYDLSLIHI